MRQFQKYFYGLLIVLLGFTEAHAQHTPFYSSIQKFKSEDSISFPPKDAILFIGSSSFTKWTDVQDYFPGFPIINRGFGGSALPHLILYANDIIFPYKPRQIVIYCGDNDLAASDTITAETVYKRFKQLFHLTRANLPGVSIAFVSIKPSPRRKKLMPKMSEANSLIKKFLKKQKKASFIDVYHKMLNKDGSPIGEIFTKDSLHMNAKGYKIWQKMIEPHLIK